MTGEVLDWHITFLHQRYSLHDSIAKIEILAQCNAINDEPELLTECNAINDEPELLAQCNASNGRDYRLWLHFSLSYPHPTKNPVYPWYLLKPKVNSIYYQNCCGEIDRAILSATTLLEQSLWA